MSRLEELHAQLVIASSIAENRGWSDIARELDRLARLLAMKPHGDQGRLAPFGHSLETRETGQLEFTAH